MKTVLAALAALALLAVAVPATAQPDPQGLSIAVTGAGTVPYVGSGSFAVNVTVGCGELLQNPGDDVLVNVTDAPSWMNVSEVAIAASPADCDFNTGKVTASGSLPFKVAANAPAVSLVTVKVKGTLGDSLESNEMGAPLSVAYKSCFSLKPSVTFPLTVTNKTTTFTVLGTQCSNAPSMIMVDDFSAADGALISGIGARQYQNKAGTPDTYTYTVTFTAPSDEDWVSANSTLKVFGHYNFDGMAGDPMDRATITWQFLNGGVPSETQGGGKSSPAPVGAITALGLLGLAAVLRRKA